MTALRAFLTALYDDVSEAEMAALQHGQTRLAELLRAGEIPRDVPLPVYHASAVEVTLDVRLEAEASDDGLQLTVGEPAPEEASMLRLTLDLFELVDERDLDELDLDDLIDDGPEGPRDPRHRPVTDVHGIGPTYGSRLHAQGIETLGDLVELSPEAVADAVSGERIDVDPATVEEWLEAARGLLAVLPEGEAERPVELVDGIGPTFGRRLREHDVASLSDLVQRSPDEIAELISTEELTISAQQAAGWLEQAERVLEGEDPADLSEADPHEPNDERSSSDATGDDPADDSAHSNETEDDES